MDEVMSKSVYQPEGRTRDDDDVDEDTRVMLEDVDEKSTAEGGDPQDLVNGMERRKSSTSSTVSLPDRKSTFNRQNSEVKIEEILREVFSPDAEIISSTDNIKTPIVVQRPPVTRSRSAAKKPPLPPKTNSKSMSAKPTQKPRGPPLAVKKPEVVQNHVKKTANKPPLPKFNTAKKEPATAAKDVQPAAKPNKLPPSKSISIEEKERVASLETASPKDSINTATLKPQPTTPTPKQQLNHQKEKPKDSTAKPKSSPMTTSFTKVNNSKPKGPVGPASRKI